MKLKILIIGLLLFIRVRIKYYGSVVIGVNKVVFKATYYYTPIVCASLTGVGEGNMITLGNRRVRLYFSDADLADLRLEGCVKVNCEGIRPITINNDFEEIPYPLDSKGRRLAENAIAVDNRLIAYNKVVKINKSLYIASDNGQAIRGRHIDFYMGEMGKTAFKKAIVHKPTTVEIIL